MMAVSPNFHAELSWGLFYHLTFSLHAIEWLVPPWIGFALGETLATPLQAPLQFSLLPFLLPHWTWLMSFGWSLWFLSFLYFDWDSWLMIWTCFLNQFPRCSSSWPCCRLQIKPWSLWGCLLSRGFSSFQVTLRLSWWLFAMSVHCSLFCFHISSLPLHRNPFCFGIFTAAAHGSSGSAWSYLLKLFWMKLAYFA